ncbi:MAG: hypothetical protein P1V97_06730 [Planctomycetota bacterium]|nr:hypothetical protein [Planctomycetota bacterium]
MFVRISCIAILVLIPTLVTAQEKEKSEAAKPALKTLTVKTRCLAKLKEVLVLLKHGHVLSANLKVGDGGKTRVKLANKKELQELFKDKESGEKFVKQSFPYYEVVLKNFDSIKISARPKMTEMPAKWRGSEKTAEGKLYSFAVEIPGIPEKLKAHFNQLRFFEVDGIIYWVPFGW